MSKKQLLIASLALIGALDGAPTLPQQPTDIIQYRPEAPRNLTSYDTQTRNQMQNIDTQIVNLTNEREGFRQKSETAAQQADRLLQEYQSQVAIQQNYQREMQTIDDKISQLVKKKADLAVQMRK